MGASDMDEREPYRACFRPKPRDVTVPRPAEPMARIQKVGVSVALLEAVLGPKGLGAGHGGELSSNV